MEIAELKNKLAAVQKTGDAILSRDKSKWTDEDRKVLANLKNDAEALKKEIAQAESDNELVRSFESNRAILNKPEEIKVALQAPGELQVPQRMERDEYGFLTEKEIHYRAGHWANALFNGNEKSREICRDKMGIVVRALSEGSNSKGGYSVPVEFVPTLVDLTLKYSSIRGYVRVEKMLRETKQILVNKGGASFTYIAENGTYGTTDSDLALVNLVARKAGGIMLFSNELNEDSAINVGQYVLNELAKAAAKTEQTTLWNADGSATYGGISGIRKAFVDGVDSLKGAVNATAGHQTFASVDKTDLANLIAALPESFEQNGGKAAFYCSKAAKSGIFDRLADAAVSSKSDLASKNLDQYRGYPIVTVSVLETSTGNLDQVPMIYFGDPSLFVIFGDRQDFIVQQSNEYKFDTDQFAVKASIRHDVCVFNKGTTTEAGGLVALMGNAS